MIQIGKDVYEDMYKLGFIKLVKNFSNCTTTCKSKGSRRKKKYVCEADYKNYLRAKTRQQNFTKNKQ